MQKFDGISFMWALVLMGAIALIYGVRAFLGWRQVRTDARADYDYKRANGMVPDAVNRETYEQIYGRVHGPRGPLHVAGAMLAILVVTPIAMLGFEAGLNLIYNLSGQSRVIEPGYLVWQFFLFFGMIAVWVSIAYLAARRYHRTAPGSLQFEMDQYLYGDEDYGETY
ncbi:MAG: hypothetical protein ABJN22_10900 [Litorimonas sp.]